MGKFRIVELCREKGITQKELAERVGLSPIGLAKASSGNPTFETLERIASGLGVTPAELLAPPAEGVLTCPHCGKSIAIKAEAVQ